MRRPVKRRRQWIRWARRRSLRLEQKKIEEQMEKHFKILKKEEIQTFVFDPQMQPRTRQIARDELVRRSQEKKR